MNFKTLLPQRIPESVQGDNELREYLEVCGELFDAFADTIREMDHYHDPVLVPETRLRELAKQFAMEFPRNLDPELQRIIIRDLDAIFHKNGATDVINWIFRLIGWEVELEYAWVLNPEYYDPEIVKMFNLSDYGKQQEPPIITNFYSRDYRSFLLGEEYVFDNGTYFRGRRFFDKRDSYLKNEIVGEHYEAVTKTRTADKVMSTPYLFIRVSEESYNIFIQPYVDEETGEAYDYTEVEFFNVVDNIFNFFMFNVNRPTNVRVVIVVAPQFLDDVAVITDDYSDEYTSEPLELLDEAILDDEENSYLVHSAEAGPTFLAGTPPSPFNKDMVINPVAFRNLTGWQDGAQFYYVDHNEFNYQILRREEDYIGPRCGASDWTFITPHEDSYQFRRVFTYEETLVDLTSDDVGTGGVYEGDADSLRMCFDLTTDSYGIFDESSARPIIVRNSSSINSYNFNEEVKPSNAFELGNTITNPDTGTDEFDPNLIWAMDFREGGELLVDTTNKKFWYIYDMIAKYKENNLSAAWFDLVAQPKKGSLNNLTIANTFTPFFNKPVPYDFEFEVTYHEQPHWENRY